MPTSLNAGFQNNINTIQIRVNGAHSIRVTDRPLTSPVALARTIISQITETDGGIHTNDDVNEFTEGDN